LRHLLVCAVSRRTRARHVRFVSRCETDLTDSPRAFFTRDEFARTNFDGVMLMQREYRVQLERKSRILSFVSKTFLAVPLPRGRYRGSYMPTRAILPRAFIFKYFARVDTRRPTWGGGRNRDFVLNSLSRYEVTSFPREIALCTDNKEPRIVRKPREHDSSLLYIYIFFSPFLSVCRRSRAIPLLGSICDNSALNSTCRPMVASRLIRCIATIWICADCLRAYKGTCNNKATLYNAIYTQARLMASSTG